jgi:hypothetical protein
MKIFKDRKIKLKITLGEVKALHSPGGLRDHNGRAGPKNEDGERAGAERSTGGASVVVHLT